MPPDAFVQFHFLRPEWLIGLVLLPLFWLVLNARTQQSNDWGKAIDTELLKHLTPARELSKKRSKHINLLIALCFTVVAMAGPTWQEKPQPVVQVNDNMVVILDLSISMLATDTAPNRLVRTKQKLQDLLNLRKEGNTALIAFSGDSHVVTPLTDDTKTIVANLPALDPFMMPVIGSRPDLAIQQAVQLLEQGGATRGRIILMTDGVEPHQVERIHEHLRGKKIKLNILAAGTKNGAPIDLPDRGYLKDGDQVVIPKTDFSLLASLASANDGRMLAIALDDKDLKQLDVSGERLVQQQQEESQEGLDKRFDAWEDMGYLFLIVAIPFFLFAYRQGALLIVVILIYPHEPTYAFGWDDLWQTPDQQAQALLQQGKTAEAAEKFESEAHKAYAQYQSGQFEQAEQGYGIQQDITSQYNLGNALAKQQKFEEALAAYDKVLEKNPGHEDAAFNKQLIEQLMQQQQQQQQQSQSDQNQDQKNQDQSDQQNSDQQQEQSEQNQSNEDQSGQQNSDQQQSQQDQPQQDQSNQAQSEQDKDNQSQQNENEQAEQDEQEAQEDEFKNEKSEQHADEKAFAEAMPQELSDEEKQSFEQWMRRVPDDPAGLLRRKFEQQARERNRTAREQGEPLW